MSELEAIRRITNNEPAPEPDPAPPMPCPACGEHTRADGTCQNAECEEYVSE